MDASSIFVTRPDLLLRLLRLEPLERKREKTPAPVNVADLHGIERAYLSDKDTVVISFSILVAHLLHQY